MQQEQRRANEAEDRLKVTARQSEERVSSLETKLSELSDVVGNYERLRFQDRTAIQVCGIVIFRNKWQSFIIYEY